MTLLLEIYVVLNFSLVDKVDSNDPRGEALPGRMIMDKNKDDNLWFD